MLLRLMTDSRAAASNDEEMRGCVLEDLREAKTGINTMTAEDPMTCVAIGTGKFIEFLAGYRDEVK